MKAGEPTTPKSGTGRWFQQKTETINYLNKT